MKLGDAGCGGWRFVGAGVQRLRSVAPDGETHADWHQAVARFGGGRPPAAWELRLSRHVIRCICAVRRTGRSLTAHARNPRSAVSASHARLRGGMKTGSGTFPRDRIATKGWTTLTEAWTRLP